MLLRTLLTFVCSRVLKIKLKPHLKVLQSTSDQVASTSSTIPTGITGISVPVASPPALENSKENMRGNSANGIDDPQSTLSSPSKDSIEESAPSPLTANQQNEITTTDKPREQELMTIVSNPASSADGPGPSEAEKACMDEAEVRPHNTMDTLAVSFHESQNKLLMEFEAANKAGPSTQHNMVSEDVQQMQHADKQRSGGKQGNAKVKGPSTKIITPQ
ncbi:hypothetical protein AX17_006817 [Amanita inopinata Kibby_2008]|nr:hypothetical protein AX17_006817 [Amanita inopinata Kibby_2008]